MSALRDAMPAAKERLPLPQLLAHLDLAAHARKSARCPLHEDQSPSFSVFQGTHGWRWKCHAGCGEGDEIDFLEAYFGLSRGEAMRRYAGMAGQTAEPPDHKTRRGHQPAPVALTLPDDATPGSEEDWCELAELRHLTKFAPAMAARLGTLLFGTVCGQRCWIITDQRRLCAEARRMDGEPFHALCTLGERKAHTLRGSVKNWPVGLAVRKFDVSEFRAFLAVEGGPDYLAALDFSLAGDSDCLPFAFLGAGTADAIHPEALQLLRGRRVRFYPHHEANGAGRSAVKKWSRQLATVGCDIDAFDFAGFHRFDGAPIKDLNDCTQPSNRDAAELEATILP